MNEHTVPNEASGYLFEFRGRLPLRETARWMTGLGLILGGVAIAVLGNGSSSYLSLPLGIAIAVLGVILLITYAHDKNQNRAAPVQVGKHRIRSVARVNGEQQPIASELALLADLYSRGALTQREFDAAKRRILDN